MEGTKNTFSGQNIKLKVLHLSLTLFLGLNATISLYKVLKG